MNTPSLHKQDDVAPWYRQFWAWFVLGPLLLVIVVAGFTVSTAFRYADDVVSDNYYKDGRMINQVLEQDEAAAVLGLKGTVEIDNSLGEVHVALTADKPLSDRLLLLFSHPVSADKDLKLLLQQNAPGHYRADLTAPIQYRWYLRVLPLATGATSIPDDVDALEHSAAWRLDGEIDLSKGSVIEFSAP